LTYPSGGGSPRLLTVQPVGRAESVLKAVFWSRILESVLKAYSIGFFGALLAVVLAAAIWLATKPREETGLVWGDTTYTSKQQFNGYLKSKGLSYKVWLERNPGAAPWEPAPARARTAASETETRGERTTRQVVEDWVTGLPLTPIGVLLATGGALLFLRTLRPILARVPTWPATPSAVRNSEGFDHRSRALPSVRRLGTVASSAARRFEASVPRYTERLIRAAQAEAQLLPAVMRERNIRTGDLVFCLLGIAAAGFFVLFVTVLVSS
jgi:hypothetical protein